MAQLVSFRAKVSLVQRGGVAHMLLTRDIDAAFFQADDLSRIVRQQPARCHAEVLQHEGRPFVLTRIKGQI